MGFIKNLVTFGASGRIERKIEEFNQWKEEYEELYEEMERKRKETNSVLEEVVTSKVRAIKALKKIHKISKNLKGKDREILLRKMGEELETVDFNNIDSTISAADAALNATKGLATGVGTALGAWALVSTFGTASTGAAITGLSGVAASNATLAWFGGGAMATGGGGMAAGTVALGGIVLLPALVLTGVFSHLSANKKINEIEEQIYSIMESMDQIKTNLLQMSLVVTRGNELLVSLQKSTEVFNQEFKRTYKEIYSYPFISRLFKWVRKNIFRRNYFSKKDLNNIAYIGGLASDFAVLIDTKIFEE
ncbi:MULTISPECIES: hypothetical protein [Bacillus cereus group]|uniref:hypothetical protein n=1 Tax=Bacillus cereus group TaxID=86661 RepID=UPI0007DB5135|nr:MULTISPECIES: hypothetical protein [Bacillus cereus group]KAA0778869.1 hypothetical protein DN392_01835 [Bacillus sp. BB51/4]OAK27023.1 hypothetical protein A6282_21935 [Bacillus wiedmannii]OAK33915.1 hypothetical protein A6286_14610 [Bacillus wiedmannii]